MNSSGWSDLLGNQVAFVAHKGDGDLVSGVLVRLLWVWERWLKGVKRGRRRAEQSRAGEVGGATHLQPLRQVIEGFAAGDVKHQQRTRSVAVVGSTQAQSRLAK